MSNLSRRKWIATGIGAAAGASGLAVAANLAGRYGLVPPDHGGLYGVGESLNYAAHRLTRNAMAREFDRSQISPRPFPNETSAKGPEYERLKAGAFAEWKLSIDGLVARPGQLSLAEIKRYPQRSQITHLACEEGWSYIAEWTGAPLAHVLNVVGILPQAKYVVYFSMQKDWWDSVDMDEAMHPQTLVAYGLNGGELPEGNGGPLRVRVPRQLGYKSVKYVNHITVTDSLKGFGAGLGSAAPEGGYAWYAGI